jgi:hypothetical protein
VDVVAEKNRKTAMANRLRTVIRCEEKAAERAYLALGRYYYHNLRDASNAETENYCVGIETAEQRIEDAMLKLEELNREEETVAASVAVIGEEDVQLPMIPVVEDAVPEGFVDEAVEVMETAAEEMPAEKDASEDLPYA